MQEKTRTKFEAMKKLIAEGAAVADASKQAGMAVSYYYHLTQRGAEQKPKKVKAQTIVAETPQANDGFVFVVPMNRLREFIGAMQ